MGGGLCQHLHTVIAANTGNTISNMEVLIDRTKVYTNGEWIHGIARLQSKIHDIKEITIELQGVLIRMEPFTKTVASQDTKFFTVLEKLHVRDTDDQFSEQACDQAYKFAIQFPGHGLGDTVSLPATTLNLSLGTVYEIRYLVTATVIRQKLFARNLQQTVEIEFMPSASLNLLLEPNVVYREQFGSMPFFVKISMPRYLAQEDAPAIARIEILQPAHARYKLKSVNASLKIKMFKGEKRWFLCGYSINCKILSENLIEIQPTQYHNICPTFSVSGVALRYYLELEITVIEATAQSHHKCKFLKPIDLLPTLLYKSHCEEFALPEEIGEASRLNSSRI